MRACVKGSRETGERNKDEKWLLLVACSQTRPSATPSLCVHKARLAPGCVNDAGQL